MRIELSGLFRRKLTLIRISAVTIYTKITGVSVSECNDERYYNGE